MNELWYDREAANWDEALPLGNGRMGAMVFSGAVNERLALNDDTLWSGFPQSHDVPGAAEEYKRARGMAMEGKYREAQTLIEDKFLGKNTQRYLPLGDLLLEMPQAHADHTDYRRGLDIGNAVSSVRYTADGVIYYREAFISHPDQALVMRIWADAPGKVTFTARLACQLKSVISAQGCQITLEGQADPANDPDPAKQGMAFIAKAFVKTTNGMITAGDDALYVKNADEAVIRMTWRTNFFDAFTPPMLGNIPHRDICDKDMINALELDYEALKTRHIKDHQSLFNRVDIRFCTDENISKDNLTLPERLAKWEEAENDTDLFALLFQYGRYLMIAGSRAGTRPLNLQGIWSHHIWPPWSGNYTVNINTEMNYWPADVTNLAECHEPLLSFTRVLRKTGAKTAREHYGARGFTVHHNTDLWGMSTPVAKGDTFGAARWAFWSLAGGWLANHAFNHYLYTRNDAFLWETAWPAVRDAARFFLDVLTEDTDGTFIFAPSTSPENDFTHDGGQLAVCKTTTMTTAIIKETLINAIYCCDKLKTESCLIEKYNLPPHPEADFYVKAAEALVKFPVYGIGQRGELLEWSEELPEHEPWHRHTSHLYPLYPGREIEAGTALADACRKTLDLRGDESTGWALAWRINLFARLRDAERAFSFLKMQLRPSEGWRGGCYPNLFGSHPPFQIDSNFGATAGIAEMLLQSKPDNTIYLLPALPKALGNGYVRGLRAMGGVTVDMEFEGAVLTKAVLTLDSHILAQDFTVVYEGKHTPLRLSPGQAAVFTP
ncbi:MAG: glycoside hydrolase family 95 protein [Defluviitaleaceae bacterium]|nr:glycoside hydrolase family 95 protein [Defluviitaleaceae bacterium]